MTRHHALPIQPDPGDSPFELVAEFDPRGDQPEAIRALVAGWRAGKRDQTLLGVTGSGKTFTMAQVIRELGRPALLLAHNKTLAGQLYGEMKAFFPNNAVEFFVSYYDYYQPEAYVPRTDTFIEKDSSINDRLDRLRHGATRAMLSRRDVIIVASVSCIYGIGSPDSYQEMSLEVAVGQEIDQRSLLRKLVEMQYQRIAIVVMPGNHTLLPTLEALDGLFGSDREAAELPETDPDTLPVPTGTTRVLSSLEVHVNEALLSELDPYLLNREQKRIFANTIPTGYPIPFLGITSPFGLRVHPTLQSTRFHPGVDLQAAMNTQVITTADGVVEFAGMDTGKLGLNGLGQVISIQHHFGFTSTYSHLNKTLVKAGDFVKKGDLIGMTGKSGLVTAPHLHYEIRFIHQYLNPAAFMEWSPEHPDRLFSEKSVQWLALLDMINVQQKSSPSSTTTTIARQIPSPPSSRTPAPRVMAQHPVRPHIPK